MNETNSPLIIGIGELLWDMLPTGKVVGGAPVNFVYHATKQGARGYAISAIGNDALGEELSDKLNQNGIKHCLSRSPYPTGTVQVTLNNGIPSYDIVENVAWDHIQVSEEAIALMKKADAVTFGTLAMRNEDSRKTIEALLSYMPDSALKFFDINLRGTYYSRELIDSLLTKANAFKINDEELKILISMFALPDGEDDACRELMKRYDLRYLVLTAGDKYSAVYTPDEKSFLPTPEVKVVDTVGAGDSFSGAFVCGILTGKSVCESHESAVRTAAFVAAHAGAWAAP
ncbi:MAG: carbohydrate kinase [Alphaproteobacteria bacterium]|nr:carbohydrate kinase [Alphaproteobacteria bacterium]MBO4643822.1 carbohydrate kinase [Alphaproteobacteria bacterium]